MEPPTKQTEPLLPQTPVPKEDPPAFKRSPQRKILAVLFLVGVSTYLIWNATRTPEPLPPPPRQAVLQPTEWRMAASEAPTPRTEVTAAELNGRAYVIGGLTADSRISDAVDVYDLTTEEWSKGPPLPAGRHHTTAVTYDNKIYVMGGYAERHGNVSKTVYIFDGQTWQNGVDLPTPAAAHAAVVLSNRIYVVGGVDAGGKDTTKLYSFGRGDQAWKTEPSMSVPRDHLAAASLAGKLYAIGGRDRSTMLLDANEVYDPATGKWARAENLPTGRSGLSAAVFAGKAYVIGGESREKTFTEVEVLDGKTGKWSSGPSLAAGRHGIGSAPFNDRIYVFLGGPKPGLTVSSKVQILQFSD